MTEGNIVLPVCVYNECDDVWWQSCSTTRPWSLTKNLKRATRKEDYGVGNHQFSGSLGCMFFVFGPVMILLVEAFAGYLNVCPTSKRSQNIRYVSNADVRNWFADCGNCFGSSQGWAWLVVSKQSDDFLPSLRMWDLYSKYEINHSDHA